MMLLYIRAMLLFSLVGMGLRIIQDLIDRQDIAMIAAWFALAISLFWWLGKQF